MSPNNLFMPRIDTQTNDWRWSYRPEMHLHNRKETSKELSKLPKSGVYGIYQNHAGYDSLCLYIGASTRLAYRISRIFTKKGRIGNFFLECFIHGIQRIGKMRGLNIKFFFVENPENLGFFEEYFIEKYKPICNVGKTYHKLRPKK